MDAFLVHYRIPAVVVVSAIRPYVANAASSSLIGVASSAPIDPSIVVAVAGVVVRPRYYSVVVVVVAVLDSVLTPVGDADSVSPTLDSVVVLSSCLGQTGVVAVVAVAGDTADTGHVAAAALASLRSDNVLRPVPCSPPAVRTPDTENVAGSCPAGTVAAVIVLPEDTTTASLVLPHSVPSCSRLRVVAETAAACGVVAGNYPVQDALAAVAVVVVVSAIYSTENPRPSSAADPDHWDTDSRLAVPH